MKDNIHEVQWQRALQSYVKCNKSFVSQDKTPINILSLGAHNCFEGPDFHNACIQINGQLLIGDVEFHKRSSDWMAHNHQHDPNYSNVILHIVFEESRGLSITRKCLATCASDDNLQPVGSWPFETIIVSKSKLTPYLKSPTKPTEPAITNEEYKYYAMLRLLRRTEDVFNNLQSASFDIAFSALLDNFLIKYNSFRLRPQPAHNFSYIKGMLQDSAIIRWFRIKSKSHYNLPLLFNDFINNSSNISINKHLRQELLTNVFLPLCFCVASLTTKTELLLWYWSTKTRSKYGILNRLYPTSEQKYIWQQQGMLEHYKEYYERQTSNAIDFLKDGEVSDYINYFELTKKPYTAARLGCLMDTQAQALSRAGGGN